MDKDQFLEIRICKITEEGDVSALEVLNTPLHVHLKISECIPKLRILNKNTRAWWNRICVSILTNLGGVGSGHCLNS